MSNLKEQFKLNQLPALQTELGIKNTLAMPQLEKVVLNIGVGKNRDNQKFMDLAKDNLTIIAGQKPVVRLARKAISGFKVREGDPVGLTVTLRNIKMYDFLTKLANVTLPRLRDFRGINQDSFDSRGNLTIGIKEQIIFPEITHEKAEIIHGLEVTAVFKNSNPAASQRILETIGFPFKKIDAVNPSTSLGVKEKNG